MSAAQSGDAVEWGGEGQGASRSTPTLLRVGVFVEAATSVEEAP